MSGEPPRVRLYTALDEGRVDDSIMDRIRAVQAVVAIPDPPSVQLMPLRAAKVRAEPSPPFRCRPRTRA